MAESPAKRTTPSRGTTPTSNAQSPQYKTPPRGTQAGGTPSSGGTPQTRTRGNSAQHRRKPSVFREVKYQGNQAIWDDFRAKTAKGTEISIGKRTVIGPNVNIIAEGGSIVIGADNVISEGTVIINKSKTNEVLTIGKGNLFECNARIEAGGIGDFNVLGAKCHLMTGAKIGNYCVIGPRVLVIQNRRIQDCMVVFGDNMMYNQPLMGKRNQATIHQMVKTLNRKFLEDKGVGGGGGGGRPGGSAQRTSSHTRPHGGGGQRATYAATRARPERPVQGGGTPSTSRATPNRPHKKISEMTPEERKAYLASFRKKA